MLVAVDLGNSSLKLGAFDGARLVATERVEGGLRILEDVIPFPFLTTADEVVLCSSSPAQVAPFLAMAARPVRVLGEEVRRAAVGAYDDPRDLGVDRIAAVWGGAETAGRPVVVVDAGTAITVDALLADGTLRALAIAPGPVAAAEGLRARALHLPMPSLAPGAVARPSRSTAASLRAGFVLGFAGMADRLAAEALALCPGAAVVLTGGFASMISAHLATVHTTDADAVLRGIAALHREFPG